MKKSLAGLALGVLLSIAPFVQAQSVLEFEGFTISYVGPEPGNWNMSVAAHTPQNTAIGLDTFNQSMQYFPADDLTGEGASNGSGLQGRLRVDVREGYRITGIDLHALGYGELLAGQAPDAAPGSADNSASLSLLLAAPGTLLPSSWQREDFNGFAPVALTMGTLSLDSTFTLDLAASTSAQALASVGADGVAPSHALASLGFGLLYFQVSAVPEPREWAMLLAGLVVLVGVARRRRE